MSQHTKDFKFQIKAVEENGTFEGLAAVYGNTDLGGDVVEAGAFTKTLKEKNGQVPVLWQHDSQEPVGMGDLTDSKEGLKIKGTLVMESPVAQKALALMKHGVLKGLSIGYDIVVYEVDREEGIWRLKELRLWEVSLVTFPMNPKAQVTSVKSAAEEAQSALARLVESARKNHEAGRALPAAAIDAMRTTHAAIEQAIKDFSALGTPAAKQHHEAPDLHAPFASFQFPTF